jgi:hypothetical protein
MVVVPGRLDHLPTATSLQQVLQTAAFVPPLRGEEGGLQTYRGGAGWLGEL